jgi:preprotein translocase subunit SecG
MPDWGKWVVAMAVAVGLVWIGWHVSAVLVTLHIIVCFVLIIVIMLQSGNAADLAGAFGGAGSQTAFGPRGAATFLSRATTWCAIVFMMTSLTLSFKRAGPSTGSNSVLEQTQSSAPAPAKSTPAPPIQIPVQPAAPTAPAQAPSSTPQK